MSIFFIILLAFQDVLLFPIAAFPRFISIPAIIIRRFFLPVQSKKAPKRWPYNVAQLLSQKPTGREKSLALVLQDDDIVERVARHLHYDDLVNLSLASKLTRTAVFYPSMDSSSRRDRIESLCVASCLDGQKSECWSCERVICDDCKSEKRTIRSSRVKDHFTHCYAVCTPCYLISAPGGAGPFHAKWNMQDLEMQHINCCTFQQPQWEDGGGGKR
ncbi:Ff.00g034010.m01.CDS01 [Fusarium sp. VM40]|nr:Ff.00g034010.m01.CDS01 [Fusarium sp. VM40]